jgi:hypothetical protein
MPHFWTIRVLAKATLLSLGHFSPIPMVVAAVVTDLGLIASEYNLTNYPKQYTRLWVFANVMVNLALLLLVLVPIIMLTFVLVTTIVVLAIMAEGRIHYL